MSAQKKWERRKYQNVALVALRKTRTAFLFWARQCRKSTTIGDFSFDAMSEKPGRNVIAASASLLTGSELVAKTISATEQAMIVSQEAAAMKAALENATEAKGGLKLTCANADTNKIYAGITADDYTDLYKSSKLEMRLYFDRTAYSRLRIIAPNPATARGWTGYVVRDEAMFTNPSLETDLQVAIGPIMDTDPTFKMIYACNLTKDSRHPLWQETLPPPDMTFPPNAAGHFYRGQSGMLIHRVALADAYAAGHVLYDKKAGKPMTYDEFCADPSNRLGLNNSYRLIHEAGGAAAIDIFALLTAQRRGIGQCGFALIDSEGDFLRACAVLRGLLGGGEVGVGIDGATTTGETSNPTSVTVLERVGDEYFERFVFVWKERNPKTQRERFAAILRAIAARPKGGRVRRVGIDATNEQMFARETAQDLGAMAPWELVDARNKVEPVPPGYERDPIMKTYLGDLYCAAVNGNRVACPPDEYFKIDHLMVIKSAGVFACEPDADGRHGDTFDSGKLAMWALFNKRGCAPPIAAGMGSYEAVGA